MKNRYKLDLINKYRKELMAIASILILIYHTWNSLFPDFSFLKNVESFIVSIGEVGVDMFMFLSGMACFYSYSKYKTDTNIKKPTLEFYKRRIGRVYITFLFVMTIRFILKVSNWSFIDFIKIITFYSDFESSLFVSPWFCFGIIVFYLFFPIYYHFFIKSKNKIIFSLGAIEIWLAYTLLTTFVIPQRFDLYYLTNRIPIFILGVLLSYIIKEKDPFYPKNIFTYSTIQLILGLILQYIVCIRYIDVLVPASVTFTPNIFIATSFIIIIPILFELINVKIIRKLLLFISSFTLEFYIIQEVLNYYLVKIILCHINIPLLNNIIVFISVTIVSYCIYLITNFIYKRFIKI